MVAGTHVTLARSTGPMWWMLLGHVLGGTVALVAGFTAVIAAKGGGVHRRAGLVFVAAMIAMGALASIVGTYEMKMTGVGGALTVYLVITALDAVRPLSWMGRSQRIALMAVALLFAALEYSAGAIAMGRPNHAINGVPGGMMLFLATIALLAAAGDWRVIRAGAAQGTKRLARHLWRMCFALFIASGSFFFGQVRFIPRPLRVFPVLAALGVAPLVLLVYWMWRVRLRHSLRGMTIRTARASEATS